jgi:hypothetical protein
VKVSRREFVGTAGCAAAASLCALPSFARAAKDSDARSGAGCTLLDLESNCTLPESLAGMRAALGNVHDCVVESQFAASEFSPAKFSTSKVSRVLIVAGAGAARTETFETVRGMLESGATVLWESGAAFLDPGDFARQQALALQHFGISMERPVDVWSQSGSRRATAGVKNQSARNVRAIGHEQIPYVAYRWPRETHLRDFSRVIPVSTENGRAIGHWREIPVAWSKPLGSGTIVFLGSPIGPALRAGDSDAVSLLRSLIDV